MHCNDIADRMAAWLDAELSPGEAELFARHVDTCSTCAATLARIERQRFPRLALPDTSTRDFWVALDRRLADERELARTRPPPRPPWYRRSLTLSAPVALVAAALLLISLGLAGLQTVRAGSADASVAQLEQQLQREQRLAASPTPSLPVEPVGLVSHTPFRGSL